jgi:hypothetical protein
MARSYRLLRSTPTDSHGQDCFATPM